MHVKTKQSKETKIRLTLVDEDKPKPLHSQLAMWLNATVLYRLTYEARRKPVVLYRLSYEARR